MRIRPIHELTIDELEDFAAHQQRKIDNLTAQYPGVVSEWIADEIAFATVWRDRYRQEIQNRA